MGIRLEAFQMVLRLMSDCDSNGEINLVEEISGQNCSQAMAFLFLEALQ